MEITTCHMTLRNFGYYIFNALATVDLSPFLRLRPKAKMNMFFSTLSEAKEARDWEEDPS